MSCTAEEIKEKRRLAQERLKKTKESAAQNKISVSNANASVNTVTSPGTSTKSTSTFYGNEQKDIALHEHENKMKQQHQYGQTSRILSQPYPKRDANVTQSTTASNNAKQFMSSLEKVITCTCTMISATLFQVIVSGYSDKLIDVFKTISKRSYSK